MTIKMKKASDKVSDKPSDKVKKVAKRTKKEQSDRDFYITQAAKMVPYEVDIEHNCIYVPYSMREAAIDNITVRHLVTEKGMFIELTLDETIPGDTSFNPVMTPKRVKPMQYEKPTLYPKGTMFKGREGGAIFKVTDIQKGSRGGDNYVMTYLNRPGKDDFLCYLSVIERMIGINSWIVYYG